MTAEKGKPRMGRPPSGDPVKKLSIAPRQSEYEAIRRAAEKAGVSFSRFVIAAALEKIGNEGEG